MHIIQYIICGECRTIQVKFMGYMKYLKVIQARKTHKSTVFVESMLFTMDTDPADSHVLGVDGSFEVEPFDTFLPCSTPERASSRK